MRSSPTSSGLGSSRCCPRTRVGGVIRSAITGGWSRNSTPVPARPSAGPPQPPCSLRSQQRRPCCVVRWNLPGLEAPPPLCRGRDVGPGAGPAAGRGRRGREGGLDGLGGRHDHPRPPARHEHHPPRPGHRGQGRITGICRSVSVNLQVTGSGAPVVG
jgi:hypothetical protein